MPTGISFFVLKTKNRSRGIFPFFVVAAPMHVCWWRQADVILTGEEHESRRDEDAVRLHVLVVDEGTEVKEDERHDDRRR